MIYSITKVRRLLYLVIHPQLSTILRAPDIDTPRFSEIGINLDADNDVIDLYNEWKDAEGIKIEKDLYTDVFGQTFLVKDPDGHIIRVSSKD